MTASDPGYYPSAPPPPPRTKRRGLRIALGVGGVLVALGVVASAVGSGGDDTASAGDRRPEAAATRGGGSTQEGGPAQGGSAAAQDAPVQMTARLAQDYEPGAMADGDDYFGVQVVVHNRSDEEVIANQMYFSAVDARGYVHEAEVMGTGNDSEFGHVNLGRGQKAEGIVVFKGSYKPVEISFRDGMIGPEYSAPVQ